MTETEGKPRADYEPMDFTIRRFQFLGLAEQALPVVPASATLPINRCFQVTVSPDGLSVAATSMQVAISGSTPAVSTESSGTVYLPARRLRGLLAEAPEGDVTVSVRGKKATLRAGRARWELELPVPARYIGIPSAEGAAFAKADRKALLSALGTVKHAVGRDPGRPAFTQVRIAEEDGEMFAAALDSSQFCRAPVPGFPVPLSLPGSALADLSKLLSHAAAEAVEVADHGAHVVFRVDSAELAALKMTHAWPEASDTYVRQARSHDLVLEVDKAELASALRRVQVSADEKSPVVALIADRAPDASASLTVVSGDGKGNTAEETVPAQSWNSGRHLVVVHAAFLGAMLAAHPAGTCTFRFGGDRGKQRLPVILEDAEARVLSACPSMPPQLLGY